MSSPEKSTKTVPNKAPKPELEKVTKAAATLGKPIKPNLSIKTSLERPQKSQDEATKTGPSLEKANKCPPPPPPRRNNSMGVTTNCSGEVVYSCKKESESAQVCFCVCVCPGLYLDARVFLPIQQDSMCSTKLHRKN